MSLKNQHAFPLLAFLRKLLRLSLLVTFVYLCFLARDIYSYSLTSNRTPSDAAVVLGTSVFRDRPSPVFRERINHAIDLYQAGIVQSIIFTGGQAGNDRLAESEAGREYAIQQGVPAEDILIETRSYNTCLNLIEAKRIMDANNIDRVLLVSDPLHMRRTMWLAERLGMNAYSSPTPTSRYRSMDRKAGFLVREVYSYATYTLKINKCG